MLLGLPAAFSHLLLQLSHPPLQHGQPPLRRGTLLGTRFSHTSIGFDALLVARFSNSPLCFLVRILLLITDLGGKFCRLV
jgi:hypothetical protein